MPDEPGPVTPGPMSKETFLAIAATMGLDMTDGHLDVLYPEVAALLQRVAVLRDIDTSSVAVEHAAASHPEGVA